MDKRSEQQELIKIIGILDSLNSHALTVEDANRLLFAPKEAKRLEAEGCSKLIVDLIWECCELENIQSLIPDKLESNIIKLKKQATELLKAYKKDIEQFMDSMHKIVLIEPVMIEECKRLYRENKNNFPGISGRVWILYDRNLSYTDKNPDIERYWLFDKGELIKDEPYKGSCFSQMNNKDFFLSPEIHFNILLEEGKALIAYYFGKRFTRCLEYDLICIDDKYSLCDMETVWVG